jgi:hypothetical protein
MGKVMLWLFIALICYWITPLTRIANLLDPPYLFLQAAPIGVIVAIAVWSKARSSLSSEAPPRLLSAINLGRAASIITPLLALSGAVIYTSLYSAYAQFYRPLGTSPEEIGLGYGQILSSSAGLVLELILLSISAGLAFYVTIALIWLATRGEVASSTFASLVSGRAARGAVLLFIAVLALQLVEDSRTLYNEAGRDGRSVRNGEAMTTRVSYVPGFVILNTQAREAIISPIAPDATQPQSRPASSSKPNGSATSKADECNKLNANTLYGQRLLYLGSAQSAYILYHPACKRSLRIPSADVVLNLR